MKKEILLNNNLIDFEVLNNDETITIQLNNESYDFDVKMFDNQLSLKKENKIDRLFFAKNKKEILLSLNDRSFNLKENSSEFANSQLNDNSMISPMPGKILKIMVNIGDNVSEGESLIVMEAMKMEHTIKASYSGVVRELPYNEGDLVDGNVELIKIEE